MDIDVKKVTEGHFVAQVRGDKRKPRQSGAGATWQSAVRLLLTQIKKSLKGQGSK